MTSVHVLTRCSPGYRSPEGCGRRFRPCGRSRRQESPCPVPLTSTGWSSSYGQSPRTVPTLSVRPPPPRPHAPAVTLETGDGEEAPALMLRSPLSRVPGTVALDTRCSRAIREPPSPSARFRGILRAAASSAARGRCRPPPDRRRHRTRWWSSTGASGERSNSRPPVGTQPGAIPRQDHRGPGGPPLPRLTFTLSIIRHGFKCGCYLTDESEECTLS